MDDPTHESIAVHLAYLVKGIDGINDRLDRLNGPVGKHETRIAVLEERTPGRTVAGVAGGAGTMIGAAVIMVWQYFAGGK